MNKLQTNYDGGMPLELDDIRWEDAAVREALKGIMMGLVDTEDGVIMQGCGVGDQGTTWNFGAGFIYWKNEIFYVPGGVINKTGHTVYWDIEVTYDPTGNETFEDVGVHDTYEIRRMTLKDDATPPDPYMPVDAKTLIDVLKERLGLVDTGWSTESYSAGNFSALSGTLTMGSATIRYKILGKTMIVSFEINCTVSNLFTGLSFKVPAGQTVFGGNGSSKHVQGSAACYSENDAEIGVGADIPLRVATNGTFDTIYMKKPSGRTFADGMLLIYGQISIEID